MQVNLEQGQACFEVLKMMTRQNGIHHFGTDAKKELATIIKDTYVKREHFAPVFAAIVEELAKETCDALLAG